MGVWKWGFEGCTDIVDNKVYSKKCKWLLRRGRGKDGWIWGGWGTKWIMYVEVNDLKNNDMNRGGGEDSEPGGETSGYWKLTRISKAKWW